MKYLIETEMGDFFLVPSIEKDQCEKCMSDGESECNCTWDYYYEFWDGHGWKKIYTEDYEEVNTAEWQEIKKLVDELEEEITIYDVEGEYLIHASYPGSFFLDKIYFLGSSIPSGIEENYKEYMI